MRSTHRFTSRQIVLMVLAICSAAVLAPLGAAAATGSLVNITDPVASSHKARVNGEGALAVTPRDPTTGTEAKIDSSGQLLVHGSITGSVSPLSPAKTWFASQDATPNASVSSGAVVLVGPTSQPVDVTSLTVSLGPGATSGSADIRLFAEHVPDTATDCTSAVKDLTIWHAADVTSSTPLAVSFPTPLQLGPPQSGTKTCLMAHNLFNGTAVTATVNASGFLG